MRQIGIIGVGHMGNALVQGWEQDESLCLKLYDSNPEVLKKFQEKDRIVVCHSSHDVVNASDCVLIGVKPFQVKELLKTIAQDLGSDQVLVSIAAGIPQKKLSKWVDAKCPVVRVMPNTPALVGAGVFGLCFDDSSLVDAQCTLLRSLFQKLGSVHELEESLFDAFTALIGSGPAYVFYFMEGLIESGVTLGLARKEATEMVIRLFQGSVSLVESSDSRIGELREQVCSPAGTTITGVNELDRHAVRRSIIDAVTAAYRRSLEMN